MTSCILDLTNNANLSSIEAYSDENVQETCTDTLPIPLMAGEPPACTQPGRVICIIIYNQLSMIVVHS